MAANKIQIKRTAVTGRTPNTTNSGNTQYISAGELALNMTDGIMYSSNGSVYFEIGANNTNVNVSNTLTIKAISANGSVGSSGQVLVSNGSSTYWSTSAAGGGQLYTAGSSPPNSPADGDEWLDTDTGILYKYLTDTDTSQWVELGPYNVTSPSQQGNLDGGTPSSTYGGISIIDAGGVS